MRVTPNPSGKAKWSEEESKKSWTEIVPEQMWIDLAEKLNLSPEYPKGTQTVARHITYQSHINKLAEEIRCSKKTRFRTDSEIFRVSVHLGIGFLWNIFCRKPDILNKTRAHFFYEALREIEKQMERATMIAIIKETKEKLAIQIRGNCITREDADESLKRFYKTIPDDDRVFIKEFFSKEITDNVTDINSYLMRNFAKL